MRRFIAISALLAIVFALCGCGQKPEDAVLGKFVAEVDTTGLRKIDKEEIEKSASTFKDMWMRLKKGGEADLSAPNELVVGTWKLEGNKVIVTPEKGGRNLGFVIEDGGNTLRPDAEASRGMPPGLKIAFKKE